MDDMRGHFSDNSEPAGDASDADHEEETGAVMPPEAIGQDERRMQVRAYHYWASMLGDRNFPAIEDLDPENEDDFGPYSVLLDFTAGIENPAISFLGEKLAEECGLDEPIGNLSDVPSRSLLSRITDHYLQIIANQAPIGFEAEFVNQRGVTILYRGILLPYSSDDDAIDFIYGVINWKELADQQTTDELMLQIDQALEAKNPGQREETPLADWADSPAGEPDVLDLGAAEELSEDRPADFPQPELTAASDALASLRNSYGGDAKNRIDFGANDRGGDDVGDTAVPDLAEQAEPSSDMGLADWLASARDLAEAARASEDRTRKALYAAVSRAYDFSIAAQREPEEYRQLVEDSGLTIQDRAPMTPIVKLVFGIDYDKTRLTEYAAVLSHAHHLGLGQGELAALLSEAPGGLKGIVAEERRRRREASGKPVEARDEVRKSLARKLRKLDGISLADVPSEGGEFTVLVARRLPEGQVVVLGEVADDLPLIERAAKQLLK